MTIPSLKPTDDDITRMAAWMTRHQTFRAFCCVAGAIFAGSGIGRIISTHETAVGVILIAVALPFIAIAPVGSSLLSRHVRLQRDKVYQKAGRLMAAHRLHEVVSKLQPDADCALSSEEPDGN